MRKRGLCCCPVSVHPSVTVHCIHMAEDIVKLLVWPGSPITLVFDPQCQYPIPTGTHLAQCKIHGVEKICKFRLKSLFISETV